MVRGAGLEASMSSYLIQRIAAPDNVEIHVGHELTELHGTRLGGLEGATFKERASGATRRLPRVFAIGDVRSGSTKPVASAVGEGAAVVAQIHSVLGPSRLNA
jgi:thioredoxin reductase (NADPH)